MRQPTPASARFGMRWECGDGMRWWTRSAAAGLVTAVILGITGGSPIDVPMPTHAFGWVEPTCGLTRGSTAIVRGDFGLAWRYNPASFVVMGFGVLGAGRAAVGMLSGRWARLTVRLGAFGCLVLLAAIVGLWIYQQQRAPFIMSSRG